MILGKTNTPLGSFYRRKRAQLGAPKAITATARKLGCLIYRLIKMAKVTKNPICTLMNLNTRTRSSTLYANARTVLDSILFKFQRQPKKPPPTSSFQRRKRKERPLWASTGRKSFPRESGYTKNSKAVTVVL